MKKSALIILLLTFFSAITLPAFSQEQSRKIQYEISVEGMTCASDAKKLDDIMLTKKGIYTSVTDHVTGRIKVVVAPFVDLSALRSVIVFAGFEMKEENLIQTEQQ